jgi:hypothetical protein
MLNEAANVYGGYVDSIRYCEAFEANIDDKLGAQSLVWNGAGSCLGPGRRFERFRMTNRVTHYQSHRGVQEDQQIRQEYC